MEHGTNGEGDLKRNFTDVFSNEGEVRREACFNFIHGGHRAFSFLFVWEEEGTERFLGGSRGGKEGYIILRWRGTSFLRGSKSSQRASTMGRGRGGSRMKIMYRGEKGEGAMLNVGAHQYWLGK